MTEFSSLFASLDGQDEAKASQEGPSHQEGLGGDLIYGHASVTPVPAAPPKRRYSAGAGSQHTFTGHLHVQEPLQALGNRE